MVDSDHDAIVRLGVMIQSLTDKVTAHLSRTDEHSERLRAAESKVDVMQTQILALTARHFSWPIIATAIGSIAGICGFAFMIGAKLG